MIRKVKKNYSLVNKGWKKDSFQEKSYHIIYCIIKVGLISRGCATWLHQIAKILLDF